MKLFGKDKLIAYFKAALQRNAVGHLYIFEGAVGMGKKTLCRYIAQLLLCEGSAPPCTVCRHCIKAASGNHPDILFVPIDDENPMTVDRARELVASMYVKPFLSARKIYIFPNGERLSPAVQNTLLKAFEEPPPFVTILLTTVSRDALLKTVLSRGIVLPMPGCPEHVVRDFLLDTYPKKGDTVAFLARNAAGSLGTAKRLAEDVSYLEMRHALFSALPHLAGTRSGIYAVLQCFDTYKSELPTLLSFFSSFMRDVMYVQITDGDMLLNPDYTASIADFAFSVSPRAAAACHAAAASVASEIGKGSNISLWITDFLSECWRYCHDTNCRC